MDKASVFQSLKDMKWRDMYLKPIGKYVEYHVLTPPPVPVYLPPEFQTVGAVYVSWPIYEDQVWKVHAKLVKEISEATDAWIFVPNQYWQKAVMLFLSKKGIDKSKIKFLHIPADGSWARNWGQLTVLSGKNKKPVFICEHYVGYAFQPYAKKSAKAAIALGEYLDVPVYQLPLVCEQGGNIITDGKGTIVVTQRIFEQNPDVGKVQFEKILKDYYGCKQIIVLPKLKNEVNGHADFIKFAGPETIFVSSAPKDSPWYETLEEVVNILSNARSIDGKNYNIVRVPLPTNYEHAKDFKGWNYNCGLTINGRQKKLIVPVYGAPEDKEALKVFQETLPDYKVVGIDYRDYPSGATNCQAVEVPPDVAGRLK
ncbi:agmatine deiminase family protein [Candidatus Auribacterota bacterium]